MDTLYNLNVYMYEVGLLDGSDNCVFPDLVPVGVGDLNQIKFRISNSSF